MPINTEAKSLRIEKYTPEISEEVTELLLKFKAQELTNEQRALIEELGLKFSSGIDMRELDAHVDKIFDEHPELETAREAMEKAWWDNLRDEQKSLFSDKASFNGPRTILRYRTALQSEFAPELHRKEIDYHLEHTNTYQLVVLRNRAALGYLAVWSGASALYDDHVQVDAKVVDPSLDPDAQKLIIAEFEPILDDLSMP